MVALVRERGPALTRYAVLHTGDVAAAQDLVQDALVKVFLRMRGGFDPDELEAYVRRTIATLSVDEHRRRHAFARRAHLVATPASQVGHAGRTDAAADLEAALRVLSPQERTVAVLRFYDDLTVPQIARQMRVADGTVKRYLSNALSKLEASLGPLDPPEDGVDVVPVNHRPQGAR